MANYLLGILEKVLGSLGNKKEKQKNRKILVGVTIMLISFFCFKFKNM